MAGKPTAPPGLGTGAGKDADAVYLSDPAFQEPNAGPPVERPAPTHRLRKQTRDPSPAQIRRRCEAIREHYPRLPVGEAAEPWTPPEVEGPPEWDVDKVA